MSDSRVPSREDGHSELVETVASKSVLLHLLCGLLHGLNGRIAPIWAASVVPDWCHGREQCQTLCEEVLQVGRER